MFEWDEDKNQSNIKKHGVSFEVASRVFDDPKRITILDEKHSQSELRFACVGRIDNKVLMVIFTTRENNNIRIISAGYWKQGKEMYG